MYRNVRFGGVSQILNCLSPLAVPTPQHKELVRKFGVNIATPTTDGPIPVQKYKNLRTCTVLYYFHLVVAIPHITGSQGEIFCVQKASDGNCGIFSFRPDMLHFGDSTFMLQGGFVSQTIETIVFLFNPTQNMFHQQKLHPNKFISMMDSWNHPVKRSLP